MKMVKKAKCLEKKCVAFIPFLSSFWSDCDTIIVPHRHKYDAGGLHMLTLMDINTLRRKKHCGH